jgi:hypothetical protein
MIRGRAVVAVEPRPGRCRAQAGRVRSARQGERAHGAGRLRLLLAERGPAPRIKPLTRGCLRLKKGEVSARGATYREGAVLLWGESKKVGGDLPAVSAFCPGRLSRPYYLESIVTSVDSKNVANTGRFTRFAACATKDLTRHRDLYGQVSRAVWPPGERGRPAPVLSDALRGIAERATNPRRTRSVA